MATVGKSPPPQGPSSARPAPAENESLKRSTDCIYFIGFPSSCNKGSECEYRHSEAARSNPTDCWYWLSGKCTLNANCAFRHPPLDLLGPPQTGNYAVPSAPVLRSGPPFVSTPQTASTQAVPCVFFQRGHCAKGAARCTFSHGILPPPNTKVKPAPSTTASMEAPSFKKTFGVPEKGANPTMTFHSNASKATEITRQPQVKAVDARLIVATPAAKHYTPPAVATHIHGNWSLRSRGARPLRATSVEDQNGRDFDDSMRESSPGFDVLVDDEKVGEDEYYDDDQYVRMRGQEGRRSNELDIGRHDDYNSVTDVDSDVYRGKRVCDSYNDLRDKYAREQRGASFEGPSAHDRRGPYKPESPDFIQNSSDLRHRLSKQRSGNGLRSVVSPDYKPNYRQDDRGYRSSRRDTRSPVRESSLGSRLQGRIKIPRRYPPVSVSNIYSERENDRGRYLGRRVSPSRPQRSSIHSRLRDRLRERTQEESNDGRNFRGEMRNDSAFQGNGDAFAGPRRLSELRGTKHIDNKQSVSGGKFSDSVLASSLGTEGDVSFDGPKPLSEILKRKRNAASTASTSVAVNCDSAEGVKQNENDTGKPVTISSAPEPTQSSDVQENKKALTAERDEEDAEISNKKIKLIEDEPSLPDDEKHPEIPDNGEEHVVDEELDQGGEGEGEGEGEEHELHEGFDRVYGEYDNEQDVEGYDLNEGDVGDQEGFIDEDDGDDFAKKLGVSF